MFQDYSCIGDYLYNISDFLIYDYDTVFRTTSWSQISFFIVFSFEVTFCTVASFRATRLKHMSPQLAQLQRKFLIQLIVQTLVSFVVLCIPMGAVVIIMMCRLYHFTCQFSIFKQWPTFSHRKSSYDSVELVQYFWRSLTYCHKYQLSTADQEYVQKPILL